MKGVLLLNGVPEKDFGAIEGARVYCCDGAYAWAKDKVKIYKTIGDFDSLGFIPSSPKPERIYPLEKNYTDGELAIFEMIKDGVTKIDIYGGFGGRADHFIGNLHLLYHCAKHKIKAVMRSKDEDIYAVWDSLTISAPKGTTISVLPFGGDVNIIASHGFKYDYPYTLEMGTCRGISNETTSESFGISVKDGTALVFINKKGV